MDHFKSSPFRGGAGQVDTHTLRKTSMKKLTALLLTLCFTLSILGCTEEKKSTEVKTKTTTTSTDKK
jgi:hypothetical protein